jgi:hypothetical protein
MAQEKASADTSAKLTPRENEFPNPYFPPKKESFGSIRRVIRGWAKDVMVVTQYVH